MKVDKLPLAETGNFSNIFIDYLKNSPKLAPTHSFEPSVEGFEKALSYRKLSQHSRNTLVDVLLEQYGDLSVSEKTAKNIASLKEQSTFTVTTGHQLNIFTGPLFFIYKIVSAINICSRLQEKFPEYNFVPVYWMASEDHDFEEIDHTYVDGKTYTWKTDQQGAVGRFKTTGLPELADVIPGDTAVFKKAYADSPNLADAVRNYVNELFRESGLVVVDADHPKLKAQFADITKEELVSQSSFSEVESKSNYLAEQGYKPQLNSREINLFYLDDSFRSRIELIGDRYEIVDSDLSFSKDEILQLVDSNPERFSPNVILRPLYQEVILPNLGYVGGPAEIAYWLQFKGVFDHYKVDFPVVMPRVFGLYLDANIQRKQQRLGLSYTDLFKNTDLLKKEFVRENNSSLDLDKEGTMLEDMYDSLRKKAEKLDVTLEQHIEAQLTRQKKILDNIQTKFIRAEKRNREEEMTMISAIKEDVFPGGTLQERKVNFLSIPEQNFIEELITLTDPFDKQMHIYRG